MGKLNPIFKYYAQIELKEISICHVDILPCHISKNIGFKIIYSTIPDSGQEWGCGSVHHS